MNQKIILFKYKNFNDIIVISLKFFLTYFVLLTLIISYTVSQKNDEIQYILSISKTFN